MKEETAKRAADLLHELDMLQDIKNATIIDKISGKGTWQRNPLVWVCEFELID